MPSDDDAALSRRTNPRTRFTVPSPPQRSLTSVINSSFSTIQDTELQWRGGGGNGGGGRDSRDATPDDDDDDGGGAEPERSRRAGKHLHDGVDKIRDTAFVRFWRNNVSTIVPGESARDHLALERTYLAYHRTSLILALFSVVIAQLQVLQHAPQPDKTFGFYVLGKPLAGLFAGLAILVSIVGVARWWRLQQGLLRGVAVSGGWELGVVFGGIAGAVVVAFGLILGAGIKKTYLSD